MAAPVGDDIKTEVPHNNSGSASNITAPPPLFSLRPSLERSILHPLLTPADAIDCANQLYLRLSKSDLLQSRIVYKVAHSRWYRLWFLVVTIFFTCTVILWQAPWMQRVEVTCLILFVCTINMACSLTRVDRRLLRALSETFEWPYLMVVLYTFIVFNALTQQQVDTEGKVRIVQWSTPQIHGFIQSIALCAPIGFLLSNLDAIPLYPIAVKSAILLCGLMILLRVLLLDLLSYANNGSSTDESTTLTPQHIMCIGTWLCSTIKSIGNLFAGQVTLFLINHAFITIKGIREHGWKQMTILHVPLIIQPHFAREAYVEETTNEKVEKEIAPSSQVTVPTTMTTTRAVIDAVLTTPTSPKSNVILVAPNDSPLRQTRLFTRTSLLGPTALQDLINQGGNGNDTDNPPRINRRQSVRIVSSSAAAAPLDIPRVSRRTSMASLELIVDPPLPPDPPSPRSLPASPLSLPPLPGPALTCIPESISTDPMIAPHPRRHSTDNTILSMHHCVDHRDKTERSERVASEYAFEVGGYADVLLEQSAMQSDFMPWVFPVQFRSLNPFRFIRRWIWHHRHFLTTWFVAIYVMTVVLFGVLVMLAATNDLVAKYPAVIAVATLCFVTSVCTIAVLGATVSDRRILRYLSWKFQVYFTSYSLAYVLTTQLLLPSQWYHWQCVWLWFILNVQIVLFDAAIWFNVWQKRIIIGLGVFLSVILFAIDVASRSVELNSQNSCFLTCTSLHVSSVFSLALATIFQFKYLFKLCKYPSRGIILSVPVLYLGGSQESMIPSASPAMASSVDIQK